MLRGAPFTANQNQNKALSETAYPRQSFHKKPQPKVIEESNADFQFDPDPGVCHIASKI